MKKIIIAVLFAGFSTTVLAQTETIVTTTKEWKSVPITVDDVNNTYSYTEVLPDTDDYYFAYEGYRCVPATRKITVSGEPKKYTTTIVKGTDINCYPE